VGGSIHLGKVVGIDALGLGFFDRDLQGVGVELRLSCRVETGIEIATTITHRVRVDHVYTSHGVYGIVDAGDDSSSCSSSGGQSGGADPSETASGMRLAVLGAG
jgi:hypothetical protein